MFVSGLHVIASVIFCFSCCALTVEYFLQVETVEQPICIVSAFWAGHDEFPRSADGSLARESYSYTSEKNKRISFGNSGARVSVRYSFYVILDRTLLQLLLQAGVQRRVLPLLQRSPA
jgi:hypothetical protein